MNLSLFLFGRAAFDKQDATAKGIKSHDMALFFFLLSYSARSFSIFSSFRFSLMSDGKQRFPAASPVCISSVDLASYAFLVGIDAEVPLKCHRVRVSSKKQPVAFHLLAEMQRFLGKRAGSRATEVSSQGREESRFLDKCKYQYERR